MPTVTGQLSANNDALDFIEEYLVERGMHIYRTAHDGFGALVATTKPTKTPRVMLVGHIDVVTASDAMFTLREENGKIYGRGTYDMKAAIAGYMMAVDHLSADLDNYDFGIMITTDEESRDMGVKRLLAEGYCPREAAVLLDGGYDWQVQKSAKGAWYVTLAIHDKTGHGSRPWLVNSSSLRMIKLLGEIEALFSDAGPDTNTLNINMLNAGKPGEAYNQIPAITIAGLDMRFVPHADRERIEHDVHALCEKYGATLETLVTFDAIEHDMEEPHMACFIDNIERYTGLASGGVMSYAASDANWFVERGLACIVTYPLGGGHHSEEEHIDAKSLADLTPILLGYLKEMARAKNDALVELEPVAH